MKADSERKGITIINKIIFCCACCYFLFAIGVGEQGKPEHLTAAESAEYDKLFKENGFNAALSDKIALDRAVPDIRHKGYLISIICILQQMKITGVFRCQSKKYLKRLGTISVIVPFHNEHWTTLLRTVHSVINRSPPSLLKEIILVDDCSSKGKNMNRSTVENNNESFSLVSSGSYLQ